MKITISIILGCALGFSAHLLLSRWPATRQHWAAIERYNAYVSNPSNYKPDAATGFSATTLPGDIEPDLAVLVAAGELMHMDMVLPTVPYGHEAVAHWMRFAQNHREIVYITGNSSYAAFKPSAAQPLHLNIWYRDGDESVIVTLLRELEETYGKKAA